MNLYNLSNKLLNAHWSRFFGFLFLILLFLISEKIFLIVASAILLVFCLAVLIVLKKDWMET
jgi:ABC-type bacteriocin/lantibiotic exporter with double-glycine peptidase domain